MAITKITRDALNTGIDDNSDATAITIDSSERVGIGVTSASGKLHLSDSGAVNQAHTIFSLDNRDSTFGANLAKSSGTYTTPAQNISGGAWEYRPANSVNNHGDMVYLSAPDTNSTSSTPIERLRIDASGRVTAPYQPIFYAVATDNFNHANGRYSTLANWNANINRGSIFSTTTGKFTAPVDGVYQISAGLSFSGTSTDVGDGWGVRLWKNGGAFTNHEIAYAQGAESGVEGHSNITIYMDLNANDYVEMGGDGSNDSINVLHLFFGGHLVG